MSRKFLLVIMLIVVVSLTAGCLNLDEPPNPDGGIWDRYFVYPLSWAITYFAEVLNPTDDIADDRYGWAIVIVTILLRFLTLPLMVKQLKNSKAMQALQPEMQKIREKYKENKEKLQQETMKLFQQNKVNPLAGCLPLLVQMPILLAFYHAIMRNEHIASHGFLWLPDLGMPDPFYLLPVLAGITTYAQQKMMGMASNPQMRILMIILPIMIFIFAIYFPSALSLYWVIGNIFTIIQTYFLRGNYPVKQEVASK